MSFRNVHGEYYFLGAGGHPAEKNLASGRRGAAVSSKTVSIFASTPSGSGFPPHDQKQMQQLQHVAAAEAAGSSSHMLQQQQQQAAAAHLQSRYLAPTPRRALHCG